MFVILQKLFNKLFNNPSPVDDSVLPTTFEQAVDWVVARLSNKNDVTTMGWHFSGGMKVRNELGLWHKENPLYKHMQERFGLCHADDTGSIISKAAHAKINNEFYDPTPDIDKCKKHWTLLGYDPATMEPLN